MKDLGDAVAAALLHQADGIYGCEPRMRPAEEEKNVRPSHRADIFISSAAVFHMPVLLRRLAARNLFSDGLWAAMLFL